MPSIMQMARAGRNGDTTMAHLTPGEMVVPKEVAAMRPDLVAHVQNAIAQYGVDPSRYVVGQNARTNPTTGAQEFATAEEITAAYQQQLGRAPDAAGLAFWQDPANGFSATGGSFATGVAAEKAAAPAPNAAPTPDTSGGYSAPSPAPAPALSLGSVSAPSPAPAPAAPAVDWSSIYRNVAGRDADTSSLDYWNQQTASQGADAAYQAFLNGLKANGEVYNPNESLADASKAYTGPTSSAGTTSVDEWARNLLGRPATAAEIAQYGSYTDPTSAAAAYAAFAAANGKNPADMSIAQASQLTPQQQQIKAKAAAQGVTLLGDPTQWVVTPDQTVEGRINNLVNPNSPIIQQAMARAAQQANSRGLLNSSIATTAGQDAAYTAAMPIATADAATFAKAAGYNADESNQFAVQNANYQNTMAIQQFNADTQKQLSTLTAQQQADANKIAADNTTLLNTNAQAAQAFNQHSVNLANINASSTMDTVAKRIAIANENASFQSQLNVLGSVAGLNLSSLLSFAGMDGFNAQGVYVGINPDGSTFGTMPVAPTPVAGVPTPGAPGDGG
ncbi:MAG: hypothetical protein V4505_00700 [Pseudomonadota bacterium]